MYHKNRMRTFLYPWQKHYAVIVIWWHHMNSSITAITCQLWPFLNIKLKKIVVVTLCLSLSCIKITVCQNWKNCQALISQNVSTNLVMGLTDTKLLSKKDIKEIYFEFLSIWFVKLYLNPISTWEKVFWLYTEGT